MSNPPVSTGHLKYSDYAQGAAIVSGIVGASTLVTSHDPTVAGVAALATTILTAISQFLQSKGD